MVDFRLFHHFIQEAYPHHPIGNDSVWTHEIPSIASNHDYLLRSMLALSASDLVSDSTASTLSRNLTCTAINHRIKAIASLNTAISSGVNSFEEGNAMLATCFILLFQSTLISDGLVEYMTFIRGTIAIATYMGSQQIAFIFRELWGNQEVNSMDSALKQTPLIHGEFAKSACRSIENLFPLCKSQGQLDMYGALLITARSLVTSSRDAYFSLRSIYNVFSIKMSHEDLRDLTRISNDTVNAILAHLVALQLIMTPITRVERLQRDTRHVVRDKFNDGKIVKWLRHLHANVPDHMSKYYGWTRYVEDEIINGKHFGDKWE
ncbi:uncharacterized protein EAE97_011906 [Botrytis byssoidea]|uniref:Uncharacterized protein n=1 Tax=Botrytis byssoidea TaxID=139641 RepID=A0A9P5HNJ8_9HELO|nr:uncharacterized protein EAE97_011906 [Botrytis byssoidea]KAF7918135.1 hypothetical protein EAE97_011906 [Botrytis byssoidea]